MDKQAIIEELTYIIGDYLKAQNFDLVELIYRYEANGLSLRILADRPQGGITLDECSRISRDIGLVLDEKDIIPGRYTLEVSSPGLDRPLKTREDFSRCVNRKAKFFLSEPIGARLEIDGVIKDVGEKSVFVQLEYELTEIPLAKINKAKQII